MYIKDIRIARYRHMTNIELGEFSRPPESSDLIALAGPNGGGKSSILELVSLALSSMYSLTFSLNRTAPQSSFEVTVGLLPDEIELIRQRLPDRNAPHLNQAFEYLEKNRSYCRSFRYEGGKYDINPTLHNHAHELVISVLRGDYFRPLGFHLGADRSYQKRTFDRNLLWNYTQYTSNNHVWSYAFQASQHQYEDMFTFLITWRFHYVHRLGDWYERKNAGLIDDPAAQPPRDEYGDILGHVFPGYQFVRQKEDAPTDLFVRLPSGEVISFSDLSSGEKEVFFTLCFFQRHNVERAVIVLDEPELHLHPSLARILLRAMQRLKKNNQIWLATQSSEVIDEVGRDRVFFVRRREDRTAEVLPSTNENVALSCLRDFFGHSGYIGLARAMVFTEGRNASVDRKMFSKLLQDRAREVKFIPANGCSEVERINRAVLSLLESNLGWCQFFLIRDRDYMDHAMAESYRVKGQGRLFVLDRHELENYLIDCDLIASIVTDLFGIVMSEDEVKNAFAKCARKMAGGVLRDMVAFRLNLAFRPEDFSVPRLLQGEIMISDRGEWDSDKLASLRSGLAEKCDKVVSSLGQKVQGHDYSALFDACKSEVENALRGAETQWIQVFPGKELLSAFCKEVGVLKNQNPVLANAIVKEMAARPDRIPSGLREILDTVSSVG